MRRFFAYGPALLVLAVAMSVLVIAPSVVKKVHTARLAAEVVLARHQIEDGSILQELNAANRAVADATLPGVVHVQSAGGFRGAEGSGWIYDGDGHIITNAHVVEGLDRTRVEMYDGRVKTAQVVGADPKTDIAVLRVRMDTSDFTLPTQYENSSPQVGDRVFAFGSPFGIKFSMSEGIVSGLSRGDAAALMSLRQGYTNFIQTDAAINPGNSGGPLVDVRGRVIGMSTAIANGRPLEGEDRVQGQSAGIGFAIPVRTIEKVAGQLIDGKAVIRGYLGITLPGSPTINRRAMIEEGYEGAGVFVGEAPEDQPASKAGIEQGDIILAVDGEITPSVAVLRSAISLQPPGEEVEFMIWRDGETKTIGVTLGAAVNVDVRDPRQSDLKYIPGSEDMTPEEIQEAAEAKKASVERQASAE